MAAWEERIEPSLAWQAIERFRADVGGLEEAHSGHNVLSRPTHLVEAAAARLRALDADFAFDELLNTLGTRIDAMSQAIRGHLEPAEGDPETDRGTVDAAADQVAQAVAWLPPGGDDERVALVDAYRRDLEGLHQQIATWLQEARSTVEAAAAQHKADLEARDAQASTLGTRLGEIEASVTEMRATVDSFIADRTAAAEAAATAAKSAHDTQHANASTEIASLLAEAKQSFETEAERERGEHQAHLTNQQEAGQAALAAIDELKARAEKLVGAVGRTGLSGGFQQWEEAERKQANAMRIVAIVFGVLAALSVVGMLIVRELPRGEPEDVSVALAIGALAVPGAFGGVAAYAGRESGRHRRNQVLADTLDEHRGDTLFGDGAKAR